MHSHISEILLVTRSLCVNIVDTFYLKQQLSRAFVPHKIVYRVSPKRFLAMAPRAYVRNVRVRSEKHAS